MRVITIQLSDDLYQEFQQLTNQSGRKVEIVINQAVGLMKTFLEEEARGNLMGVYDTRASLVRQIRLSSS